MTAGDRVRFVEEDSRMPQLGTVAKVRPSGYVKVRWDEPYGMTSYFTKATAERILTVVTGVDALPRHDWDCTPKVIDPKCDRCGATQTDDNELGPCEVAP